MALVANSLLHKSFEDMTLETLDNLKSTTNQHDYIKSIETLHHNFVMAIHNSRPDETFEVISNWTEHLKKFLETGKSIDIQTPDESFRKLLEILQMEIETWDLISTLYYFRLTNNEEPTELPTTIQDMHHVNEMPYVQQISQSSRSLKINAMIINWLEKNHLSNPIPELDERFVMWEQTLECLKRDLLVSKVSNETLITHMDPDAITRELKHVNPLDYEDQTRVHKGAFYYLRSGENEAAQAFLSESGHFYLAAIISGPTFTEKRINEETGEPKITGNPSRDFWKSSTYDICEDSNQSKYERAILGALCGHRKAILNISTSWEDRLWAFMKVSLDVQIEDELRKRSNAKYDEMPLEYWTQKLSLQECLNSIRDAESENVLDIIFRTTQKCVMLDNIEQLNSFLKEIIDPLMQSKEHPLLVQQIIRFVTHMLLVFRNVELPTEQHLLETYIDPYVNILVNSNQLVYIPYYIEKMSPESQLPLLTSQICESQNLKEDEIDELYEAATFNNLNVLAIGTSVVEKFRELQDDFEPNGLLWISMAIKFNSNEAEVLLAHLRYSLIVTRKYLVHANTQKARTVINKITDEAIREIQSLPYNFEDTLLRELSSYRVYLDAEEAQNKWLKAQNQKPKGGPLLLREEATQADVALHETREKERKVQYAKWERAYHHHMKVAIERCFAVLKFPSGWLADCVNIISPEEEVESRQLKSVRRVILPQVTYGLLNMLKKGKKGAEIREFAYILCDSKQKIMDVFSPNDIGVIFKSLEEYTRKNSKNLLTLPK